MAERRPHDPFSDTITSCSTLNLLQLSKLRVGRKVWSGASRHFRCFGVGTYGERFRQSFPALAPYNDLEAHLRSVRCSLTTRRPMAVWSSVGFERHLGRALKAIGWSIQSHFVSEIGRRHFFASVRANRSFFVSRARTSPAAWLLIADDHRSIGSMSRGAATGETFWYVSNGVSKEFFEASKPRAMSVLPSSCSCSTIHD